jgi:hypothetical protein
MMNLHRDDAHTFHINVLKFESMLSWNCIWYAELAMYLPLAVLVQEISSGRPLVCGIKTSFVNHHPKHNILRQDVGGDIMHQVPNPSITRHRFSHCPVLPSVVLEQNWKHRCERGALSPTGSPELRCVPILNCHPSCRCEQGLISDVDW